MPGPHGGLENGHDQQQPSDRQPEPAHDSSTNEADDAETPPALQVVVLGAGGGPLENNITAFLVRSVAEKWQKGSMVAVDAGVHLAAITRILEETQPSNLASLPLPHVLQSGPFAGYELSSASASANAAQMARSLVDTYLITHPHLDHISGFVVNTAGLPGGQRPKRLAGLPSTIDAFKNHIFNNVIWPNLSDENGGVGLVTYMRLVDGGSPAVGEGDARGYIEIAEGISVKAISVSHGEPIRPPTHRGSQSSAASTPARFSSFDASSMTPSLSQQQYHQQQHQHHQHSHPYFSSQQNQHFPPRSVHYSPSLTGMNQPYGRSSSGQFQPQFNGIPGQMGISSQSAHQSPSFAEQAPPSHPCVYDSTTFFLRDTRTGSEVLIFGDVEPDSLSSLPRNMPIWQEAAPKIATGKLGAIFIECSYDDSHPSERMFGHLKPTFIMEEIRALSNEVGLFLALNGGGDEEDGEEDEGGSSLFRGHKKRKRAHSELRRPSRRRTGGSSGTGDAVSPKTVRSRFNSSADDDPPPSAAGHTQDITDAAGAGVPPAATPHLATPTAELSLREAETRPNAVLSNAREPSMDGSMVRNENHEDHQAPGQQQQQEQLIKPLDGLKVVIVHVKDKLDGADQGAKILSELREHEARSKTGVEFIVSYPGQSIYV